MKTLWQKIRSFRPRVIPSCVVAALFCGAALLTVTTALGGRIAPAACCALDTFAAVSLTMAVWSIVLLCKRIAREKRLTELAHRGKLTGKLWDDGSFRTVTLTCGSLAMNVLMTLEKGVAGWLTGSWWLITFSAYYLILTAARFLLIKSSRALAGIEEKNRREKQEWEAYRACGSLLLSMTVVLFGVVVLIVKEGNRFTYRGTLIFAVALWDFYCLIMAIRFMIRNRKRHAPIIVAIKTIGFATALVSILSLQTAMFASFGGEMAFQNSMNLLTGSAVSLTLLATGLAMVVKSNKMLRKRTQKEAVS